jgi:hypothetical protein
MDPINNIRHVTTYDASISHTNNVQVNGADTVYPVNVNGIPVTNTNLIQVDGADNIQVYGNEVQFVQNIESTNTDIRPIGIGAIADARVFMNNTPTVVPPVVPVTEIIGSPVVNMPGCVKVHKENVKERNRNKMLVDDDPKGNTVLCDAGAPYYEPADYDYRGLSWQTVYNESDETPEGIDTGDPPSPDIPDAPSAPETPGETAGKVECPPPNARRIGDRNQKGDEQVKEYKLTPDGKICETIWEPVPIVDQYLPSIGVVTTTATIATVATASALFAKPLADLLLKAVKPVIKKVMTKVQKLLGKKEERRPNLTERMTEKYREKKGLPPLKKKKD